MRVILTTYESWGDPVKYLTLQSRKTWNRSGLIGVPRKIATPAWEIFANLRRAQRLFKKHHLDEIIYNNNHDDDDDDDELEGVNKVRESIQPFESSKSYK